MLPFYRISIDKLDKQVCFDFNSIVDVPAHLRSFDAYGKANVMYFADASKMRITGVMIAEGMPIYRNDQQLGEHFVVFFKEDIEDLWIRFNELGYTQNLNLQHSAKSIVENADAFMVEQWIVDRANNKGVPVSLEKQGIRDGSLMATYQIRNRELWNEIINGKYTGFSIEGVFLKSPLTRMSLAQEKKTDLELRNLFYHLINVKD